MFVCLSSLLTCSTEEAVGVLSSFNPCLINDLKSRKGQGLIMFSWGSSFIFSSFLIFCLHFLWLQRFASHATFEGNRSSVNVLKQFPPNFCCDCFGNEKARSYSFFWYGILKWSHLMVLKSLILVSVNFSIVKYDSKNIIRRILYKSEKKTSFDGALWKC